MNLIRSTALVAMVAFVAACASKGATAGTENAPRRDRSLITQEEIDATGLTDAYAVVRKLHPGWLLGKTTGSGRVNVQLYVEGNKAGNATALNQYQASQVREIRFLESDEATTRFGTGHGAGAILVFLRR